jgi:hypothetical protein
MREILDGWLSTEPSRDANDRLNVEHLAEIEASASGG